jgi:radical SAM protein with 4Fe4S-binding SPASM domain
MTVTASRSNLEEIPSLLDIAVELGVSAFKVGPIAPLGRALKNEAQLAISHSQIKWLASTLQTKQRELEDRMVLLLDGLFPWLLEPPPLRSDTEYFQECGPGCSAGISQVLVSFDGNVYPCPYIRSISAGNIREDSLQEIWKNKKVFAPLRQFDQKKIKGKCGNCPYHLTACSGGCRGMAVAGHNDLYAEDPYCWFEIRKNGDYINKGMNRVIA